MLLAEAVIRVGLPVPAGANASGNELSLFRRPLPTTNLAFLSAVMWDGRETLQKGSAAAMHFNLADQVRFYDVRLGLLLTAKRQADLVAFQRALYRRARRAGAPEVDELVCGLVLLMPRRPPRVARPSVPSCHARPRAAVVPR